MNAGMYHPDRSPVGLYIEDGIVRHDIVTRDGPGNFGLLPNGVFCIAAGRFAVIESRRYAKAPPECRFATQSGPMLVIDGKLHPNFLPTSDSLHFRNGVGVSADGQTAWFVLSDARVNFDSFARFFRDELKVPAALYFDGNISRLYAPELGRNDFGLPMGPMVGLAVPAD
ncbi:MAG: phosphodiester glycosidase family protein, partial [Albidovulum sp.]